MKVRTRKRVALAIAGVTLLASVKFFSVAFYSPSGIEAFDNADYAGARADFGKLRHLELFDDWKAPNNIGTAFFQEGELEKAEKNFRLAAERAPKRCDVRYNLVVTIEAIGDSLKSASPAKARDRWQEALDLAEQPGCALAKDQQPYTKGDPPQRIASAAIRLRDKLKDAPPPPKHDPNDPNGQGKGDGNGEGEDPKPTDPEAEKKQEELEVLMESGAKERRDQQPSGGRRPSHGKSW